MRCEILHPSHLCHFDASKSWAVLKCSHVPVLDWTLLIYTCHQGIQDEYSSGMVVWHWNIDIWVRLWCIYSILKHIWYRHRYVIVVIHYIDDVIYYIDYLYIIHSSIYYLESYIWCIKFYKTVHQSRHMICFIPTGAGTPWFRAPASWCARDGSPPGAQLAVEMWEFP